MKKWMLYLIWVLLLALSFVLGAWCAAETARERSAPAVPSVPRETEAVPETTAPPVQTEQPTQPETQPVTEPTQPATEATQPTTEPTEPYVYTFTEEEEKLLMKLGMAERGEAGCTECIALIMRTVLNRVESGRFSSTIKGVIYAQDQYTPVMDGSIEKVYPGVRCEKALSMIRKGWDESQGALYYEWSEGETWHSQNLELLFQHCNVRFYK